MECEGVTSETRVSKLDDIEKNNIICPEQIGFRKGCRMSHHVFTLKTLIDKFCKKNKYLFACFVDLRKAFDTMNRQALLFKLSKYNIDGRFFNIPEDMYKDVLFSLNFQMASLRHPILV